MSLYLRKIKSSKETQAPKRSRLAPQVHEEQKMVTNNMKEFVDELRTDWKNLWRNRVEDKVRAEGIAKQDYSKLFVEQGTVIMATKDFKPIEFFDIVKEHLELDNISSPQSVSRNGHCPHSRF